MIKKKFWKKILYQNNFIVDFFKDEQGYNRAFIAKFTNMRYDKK